MPFIFASIGNFVFWYPLIMSTVWIVGGVLFYFRVERKEPLPLEDTPMVSILVPCFNEEDTVEETVRNLDNLIYDCKLWDRDTITEDIGITWKLQKRFWDVRYEPRATCWMLVPETIKGFWKQRVRWAQGGMEALLRHWDIFLDWRQRRIIPVYLEELVSVIWSFCWLFTVFLSGWEFASGKSSVAPILWSGSYLSLICVIQFFFAMLIDSRYDNNLLRYYLWSVWYPTFYWYFNALVIIRALPKSLFQNRKGKFAVWESPDRGLGV